MGIKDQFYIAKCLGLNGGSILVPKIRTMEIGAEDKLTSLVDSNCLGTDGKIEND